MVNHHTCPGYHYRQSGIVDWLARFRILICRFGIYLLFTIHRMTTRDWSILPGFISNIKSRVAFLRSLLHSFHYSYHSKWAAGWYCFSLLRLSFKNCRSKRWPFILNLDSLDWRMKRIFLELRNIFFFSLFAPWLVLVFILSFLLKTIISIWNEKNNKNKYKKSTF